MDVTAWRSKSELFKPCQGAPATATDQIGSRPARRVSSGLRERKRAHYATNRRPRWRDLQTVVKSLLLLLLRERSPYELLDMNDPVFCSGCSIPCMEGNISRFEKNSMFDNHTFAP